MLVHPGLPQRSVASTHLYTLPCNKECQAQERRGGEGGRKKEESLSSPPTPVEPLSLFISTLLRRLISWLFKRLIALSTLKISVLWIRIIETNYVIHLIEVYQVNSVTQLSNNWALGKEGCSGAKSPVNRNNLTPSLECGPLDVMFEVLSTRYQPLRLYFCISNVMHNRYKHA